MVPIKQPININFLHGLDTKTDPKQVPIGRFVMLQNSIFTKAGLLSKRPGYGVLPSITNDTPTFATTFGGNFTAIGKKIQAYAQGPGEWINKGTFQPISFSTIPVVRSALNQTQADAVTAANGLVCTVYTEINNSVAAYKYVIQDSVTGQNVISPTVIPVGSGTVTGSPRVFLVGGYFFVVFTNVISATSHLQYIAISTANPSTVTANADIAAAYIAKTTLSWDGVAIGNNLYIAYNTTSGGQQIEFTYVNTTFVVAAPIAFASSICTMMGVCADLTNPASPIIYAAFYDAAGSTGYVIAVDQNLNKVMTATEIISSGTVNNITCTAQNGVCTVVLESAAVYSYDNNIASNYLQTVPVTKPATVTTGTVGSTTTVVRSVGLASKGFLYGGVMYMLAAYDGKSTTAAAFQPTCFLINLSGNVIARFAYQNGGGYLATGLPQAQVIGSSVKIPYLFKDLIQAVNKAQGAASAAGIYSQTGVNLATAAFSSSTLSVSELGQNLNLSGGMLYAYDGNTLNEQNFHLYPDSIELTAVADPSTTGTALTASHTLTVGAATGIVVGMSVADSSNPTYIPANTKVTAIVGTTITLSNATTHSISGDTIVFTGAVAAQQYFVQVIYQWTDAQGNIFNSAPSIPATLTTTSGHSSFTVSGPMLRLTYKPDVKIVIYRWSAGQQEYFQTTSISAPILNSTSSDSWTFTDISSDSQILGNGLIYTNGGVVENTGGPISTATTIWDTRLWAIDAEDQNLLGYSKQVDEGTPVEMSDLFTYYVAPNAGTSTNTGPMKCIAPMDDKLIIFKANAIYYVNGTGPDITGANNQYSQPIFITSTVGSSNQKSIVLTPRGLMFQSDKGIWLLGRDLTTEYIGAAVEDFNSATVNSAAAIPETTYILFTLSSGVTLMYDYYYNEWGTFVGAAAVSATVYQNLHTYINSQGNVFQQTPGLYQDNGNPVLMAFTTGWINPAGLQGYMRAFWFFPLGQYFTPHKLGVSVAYDYVSSAQQYTVIQPDNYSAAFGLPGPYGQGTPFGGPSDLDREQWRVFLDRQRCQALQITVQEIYDPSFGVAAGAGFSMSGIDLVIGVKKGWPSISSAHSAGGNTQ